MNNEEMKERLKLTTEQQKSFNRMKKALRDFEKAGGVFVGSNDSQYALNGINIIGHESNYDYDADKNISIRLTDTDNEYLNIADPYNVNIEEIRKGAPKGANAYKLLEHGIAYLKGDDNHWWLRAKDGWIKCSLSSHFEEQFLSGEIKPL